MMRRWLCWAHGRLTTRMFDGRPWTFRHRVALHMVRACLDELDARKQAQTKV